MEIHMIYLIESYSGWWFGHILYFSIGNFIIPTAELTPSFFRGVGRLKPPTRYEITPNHHEITIKPPLNHHFPMVFLWFSYGFTIEPPLNHHEPLRAQCLGAVAAGTDPIASKVGARGKRCELSEFTGGCMIYIYIYYIACIYIYIYIC